MPELPEVEVIRRGLRRLRGKIIAHVTVREPKLVTPRGLARQLKGRRILSVDRRGKMLIIELAHGKHLLIHLKMTGQLVLRATRGSLIVGGHFIINVEEVPNRFTRIEIDFTDGSVLYFNDVRKFGWMKLVDDKGLAREVEPFGPEPFDKKLTAARWEALLASKQNLSIKKALLDQHVIAGIGNIYVDEACYYTKVRPTRLIKTLTRIERARLLRNIRRVLLLSIKRGGTSFNTYRNAQGDRGRFYNFLKVYDQKKVRCGGKTHAVIKIKHAGRGTHYCSQCQR